MYKKAEYFSAKCFRNALSGLVIFGLVINRMIGHGHINPLVYLLPVFILSWFTMGMKIRAGLKLKQRPEDSWEEMAQSERYKIIDSVFSFIIMIGILLMERGPRLMDYLLICLGFIYLVWLLQQYRSIVKYLNS
jgi:hypothetical protein